MTSRPAATPAELAKAALRRLAMAKQEPTPENYARAWAEESGEPPPDQVMPGRARPLIEKLTSRVVDNAEERQALLKHMDQGQWDQAVRALERAAGGQASQSKAWAQLIERITRGLERSGKQWSVARKKDSLQRVLDSSRSDMQRLQHRLTQLVGSWDGEGEATDTSAPPIEAPAAEGQSAVPNAAATPALSGSAANPAANPAAGAAQPDLAVALSNWVELIGPLETTVRAALPPDGVRAAELADELSALAEQIGRDGATPQIARSVADVCERARRLLAHRHHLLDQVHRLSQELAGGLSELAEDDSWVQGQLASLRATLDDVPSARAVQSASDLLASTRSRQRGLRVERDQARNALKALIQRMLSELGELDETTGRFSDGMLRYADTIERADSLESLASVVRDMVDESRSVHTLVSNTRSRLHDEHSRATELEAKVRELETELRRLSDEVATDALTQIANRRGLMQHFDTERARLEREGTELAVGLLDIDNFKRLNDSLGHAAGDQALVALAQHVRQSLRPQDAVARFGGEEFVVLLPGTPVEEAQRALTRLQRLLSASLFMHEDKEVFVTFSAGVTSYRLGERLEEALERADEALYEAKRTGKNRTCIG
ncbi:GGDEF domain-containing protein [Ideonella margarita]|uniref:diguanylate cyclase n=1 Tax=Ideonella margarita TaxID=2984191 RepID=A0ABU9C768_9BURK